MSVRRKCVGKDDSGITLVLSVLALTGLLIVAAFAIDLGGLYNERRQDQSAADAASLGGAQDLLSSPAVLASTVDALVSETLDIAPGTIDWNTCGSASTTGDSDLVDTVVDGKNCITRDSLGSQVQVRLPVRQAPTTFAQLAGVSLDHSAAAIAGFETVGFGNVLPYGIVGANGGHACVRAGPNGIDIPPCNGPDSGNFGIIDLGIWQATDCADTPADAKRRQSETTAVGIDHVLSLYGGTPHGTTLVLDTPNCGTTSRPNGANVGPGNSHNETGQGLWSGDDFGPNNDQPARLRRTDPKLFGGVGQQASFTSGSTTYNLDDNPLWEFMPTSLPTGEDNVPLSCRRNQFDGSTGWLGDRSAVNASVRTYLETMHPDLGEQMRLLMERCFFHYRGIAWHGNGQRIDGTPTTNPAQDRPLTSPEAPSGCTGTCDDPIFGLNSSTQEEPDLWDIQYTPRFAYVPELVDPFPPGNSGTVKFKAFRPVFIQRVCLGQNSCGYEFDPGLGQGGAISGDSTSSFTAWVFHEGMLPGDLDAPNAAFQIGVNRIIRLIR